MSYLTNTQFKDFKDKVKDRFVSLENDVALLNEMAKDDLYVTQTDSTTALVKEIPTKALSVGYGVTLGGCATKSENLIVLDDKESATYNGVTITVKNGVITLNGTSTATINRDIIQNNITIQAGNYMFSSLYTGSSSYKNPVFSTDYKFNWLQAQSFKSLKFSETKTYNTLFHIYCGADVTFTNLKLYPMLVKGSTAPTTWEKGYSGISANYSTSVEMYGISGNVDYTILANTYVTSAGVIGSSTLYPTARYYKVSKGDKLMLYASGTIMYAFFENIPSLGKKSYDGSRVWDEITSTTYEYIESPIDGYLYLSGGCLNVTPIATMNTPTTITSEDFLAKVDAKLLTELTSTYGWSSEFASLVRGLGYDNSSHNYIDNAKQSFIAKYGIVDLGTLTWTKGSTYATSTGISSLVSLPTSDDTVCSMVSEKYNVVARNKTDSQYDIAIDSTGKIYIRTLDATYSPSGYLVYPLATPITTSLSSIFEECAVECNEYGQVIRKAEGGGTIVVHTNTGLAVPSCQEWLIKSV